MRGTLLASLGFEDKELSSPLHDEIVLWVHDNPKVAIDAVPLLDPPVKDDWVGRKIIEQPIYEGTRIVGYHDLLIECRRNDALHYFGIEVKTAIPSFGALLRQLRATRTHVVVCPDDRFAELLKQQRFGFVKYPYGCVRGQDELF